MWLKFEGFKDLLRVWWQSLHFSGSFSFILASKLKALEGILRAWNKEVFGRVELKRKEALSRISFWDDLEKEKELSLEEAEEREKARDDYRKWFEMEEVSWRQKSREIWLKEGDRNIGFFHRMVNSHRRRNSIRSISINGRRLVKEPKVKEGLVGAFQSLLSASNNWCPPFPNIPFNLIGEDQAAKLEEMFIEEEILAAVSGLNGDKAPGLDGFPLAFWSFSWDFVKDEVMGFFREFFEHNQFVKSLNATFLVLVPKRRGISLANRYFLCEVDEETIDHLLIHCSRAKMLWDLIFSIADSNWVFPLTVCQFLLAWQSANVGKKRKRVWMAAPLCLF